MADTMKAAPSSTSSSSRLPTVSASEILRSLDGNVKTSTTLGTGIRTLDNALYGGFEKGKTTEIWGPVGAGKTAIALTAANKAIDRKETVIWIACASPLSTTRLKAVVCKDSLKHFYDMNACSLTHLLAFVQHSADHDAFTSAGLLVVDDLNALVEFDYPRQTSFASSSESEARKWQAGRRAVILASINSALNRLANAHSLAVIVLNGCATSIRSNTGLGPVLVPAIGGSEWDAGIWNRLAVFQDFNGRFVCLQKIQGSNTAARGSTSPVLAFSLSETGLLKSDDSLPVTSSASLMQAVVSPTLTRKRTFEEIADSEGEDEYGWDDLEDSDVLEPQSAAG